MISAWWLLLIVPLSASAGLLIACVLLSAAQDFALKMQQDNDALRASLDDAAERFFQQGHDAAMAKRSVQ